MAFHNPYHFVPVLTPTDDQQSGPNVTHARYVGGTSSGRLLCRLVTEDPIVVGSDRNGQVVAPYMLDGYPALPASSLRGMISAIAEAASNSALRVLEDRPYSVRMSVKKPRVPPPGALGMIVKKEGHYTIRPLALPPSLRSQQGNNVEIPQEYRYMFKEPLRLKSYVDGYRSTGGASPTLSIYPRSFLEGNMNSYSSRNCEYWYMKLDFTQLHIKQQGGKELVLGCMPVAEHRQPLDESAYVRIGRPAGYVRGILRILGIHHRETKIPTTKKHEIFIPYPAAYAAAPTFDAQAAVEKFHKLADERTERENTLPFELKGMVRAADGQLRLDDGDIVFFRPDPSKNHLVAEVSISSIWRRRVDGTSHDFFRTISPELLPFNPERRVVSVAEQLFGFVEQRKRDSRAQGADQSARSLSGRVRIHAAQLHPVEQKDPFLAQVRLKVLDSPKPPAPSFYFKKRDQQPRAPVFIAKDELNTADHRPQGRKFYLHHRREDNREPWKTSAPNDQDTQKSDVTPLRKDLTFYFHIDFNNLSPQELGLLCYSLRPTDDFRHKLGMGKSIGLGRVRIEPVGLFLIDRNHRYRDDDPFSSKRYHEVFVGADEDINKWAAAYDMERDAAALLGNGNRRPWLSETRRVFADTMDPSIRSALELVGDPGKIRYPVQTPQIEGQDPEKETYQWFVANDRSRAQALTPLPTADGRLPTLEK